MPRRKELTVPEKRVYDYIIEYYRNIGKVPSYQELAYHFEWTHKSAAGWWVHKLIAKGYLTTVPKTEYRGYALAGR